MKTLKYVLFVVTLAMASIVFVASASASGWRWDRDAGSKARGDYGRNKPVARSCCTHQDSCSAKPCDSLSRSDCNRFRRTR
ncbi:hypothetical protein LCGC14_2225660 [marine sediment metagenome]|uniref:Uncharacterized protein n=1 Tax=marine sediment metagenome TaxID=412755 RepID=A0A0F9D9T3_9ZZZZ